jgi:hypothetical protein
VGRRNGAGPNPNRNIALFLACAKLGCAVMEICDSDDSSSVCWGDGRVVYHIHCPISASQIVFGNFPCAVLPQDEATIRLHLGKFNRTMRGKEKHVKELTEDLAMKRLPWHSREFNGQRVGDCFYSLCQHTRTYFTTSRKKEATNICLSVVRDPC